MASRLAPGSQKKTMPRCEKFSSNFDGKAIHTFWEYFIFVWQAFSKCILALQFTTFPSLSIPSSRYVTVRRVLPWPRSAKIYVTCTQGFFVTQTLQFHLHTLVELTFSSFSPANFTDHHCAYYLALEKNKGALEKKMNH